MDKHTDDLFNVREGDTVELTTSDGHVFEAKCESYNKHNDQDPDKVRTYMTWEFSAIEWGTLFVQITEGLKSFEWEAEYPRHTEVWSEDHEESLGYIEELALYGKME